MPHKCGPDSSRMGPFVFTVVRLCDDCIVSPGKCSALLGIARPKCNTEECNAFQVPNHSLQ